MSVHYYCLDLSQRSAIAKSISSTFPEEYIAISIYSSHILPTNFAIIR